MIDFPDLARGSNVVGVGIDQIEVSRIRESLQHHGETFLRKVFTEKESGFCLQRSDPAPCLAARFAAKEAVSKALGTGICGEFGWLDSEIQHQETGQPIVIFSERTYPLLQKREASSVLVSLSHLKEVASAIVILLK